MVVFQPINIKRIVSLAAALALLLIVACSDQTDGRTTDTNTDAQAEANTETRPNTPGRTVKAVMVEEIEPASNALWAVAMDENIPETDEDWQQLEQAAERLIAASHTIEAGGSGANETLWAQQPEWKDNNERMNELATAMLNNIHEKDYDALLETGFVLIEPCSACHMAFTVEEPAQ